MLKIKKDRMKDLEKFGFEEDEDKYSLVHPYYGLEYLKIDKIDRIICYDSDYLVAFEIVEDLDVIYDLITSGMVEKVEEDENHNN